MNGTGPAPGSVSGALALAVALAIAATASAQSLRPFPPHVGIHVPVPPSPVASGGNHYLLYELLLKSYVPAPVQVTRVEVFAESPAGPRLLEYAGEELGANMVFPVFIEDDPVRQRTIGARSHGVVYVLVSISRSATVPRQLFHRVWFDLPYQEEWFATPSADSTVVDRVDLATPVYSSAIEIGPPLKGGPWAAFAGLSNDGDHRRIQTQVFGRSVFSQRYAVDYLLVDTEGRAVPVAGGGNDTYPGYGREVIAVADGIVSTAVDGIPDNTPGVTTRPEVFNLTTVPGNHVMVDLGDGRYAAYAHLIPGSVEVRVGQRVRRGDVLGRVGNSGNSSAPHLHFQLADNNLPLGGEGLPYVHDAFELVGYCPEGRRGPCEMSEPELRRHETPMQNQLIRFPE
ncbi:MAG: M23 family metallopeptidase [Gemmatimonadota bacterium]|nr:M23 family metallopeptidase [Gemmatimonadota bacterium]MDE2865653.1 M23 family metallopeptidase [Gemmatimonadota bacterium]